MRKGWIIAIIAVLLLIVGIILGIYVYGKNNTKDSNKKQVEQLAVKQENNIFQENTTLHTSAIEEKVSPNSIIIEKQYYKNCDHLIRNEKDIPETLVNCSKTQFEAQYEGWTIEEFGNNQIIVYKENDDICDEHYLIKEHNGVLGIYTIDQNGNQNLKQDTEIQTMYLPEQDLERVKSGIEAIGNTELHTVLEDFE